MVSKKERSLTWKYFWKQKISEVGIVILVIFSILFIPFILGHSIGNNALCLKEGSSVLFSPTVDEDLYLFSEVSNSECIELGGHLENFGIILQWVEGSLLLILFCVLVSLVVLLMILLLDEIADWLYSNWERARKRARSDILKTKRKNTIK